MYIITHARAHMHTIIPPYILLTLYYPPAVIFNNLSFVCLFVATYSDMTCGWDCCSKKGSVLHKSLLFLRRTLQSMGQRRWRKCTVFSGWSQAK